MSRGLRTVRELQAEVLRLRRLASRRQATINRLMRELVHVQGRHALAEINAPSLSPEAVAAMPVETLESLCVPPTPRAPWWRRWFRVL